MRRHCPASLLPALGSRSVIHSKLKTQGPWGRENPQQTLLGQEQGGGGRGPELAAASAAFAALEPASSASAGQGAGDRPGRGWASASALSCPALALGWTARAGTWTARAATWCGGRSQAAGAAAGDPAACAGDRAVLHVPTSTSTSAGAGGGRHGALSTLLLPHWLPGRPPRTARLRPNPRRQLVHARRPALLRAEARKQGGQLLLRLLLAG